jgi:hypothetical protein
LAKQLSSKAENFVSEGNYEYAIRCYDKIMGLLRELVKEATSKETIEQLKNKITKFQSLKAEAEAKNSQKMEQKVKPAGFGFPGSNSISLLRNIGFNRNEPLKKSEELHIKYV